MRDPSLRRYLPRPATFVRLTRLRVPLWPIVVLLVAATFVANLPVTTTTAVDFHATTRQLPLYEKALAFIHRDVSMRALAERTVGAERDPTTRALALLNWVHEQVREVPAGFPVVDDHPLHVVIRGYGTYDQAADVLATLASYVGVPGTLVYAQDETDQILYGFCLLYVNDDWRVFDPREGRVLLNRAGRPASLSELQAEPALTRELLAPREANGVPYSRLLLLIDAPEHLRPYDQMLLTRVLNEIRKIVQGG